MADKHPYMSGSAGLVQTIAQLRRAFPAQLTSETLKKLGIAPNNETFVLNILRFIGVIDEEGKKTDKASKVFSKHEDLDFQQGLSELVESAYADLFGLHADAAWTLPTQKLIAYFRNTDQTSAIVGQRQASTFQALASLSGKNDGGAVSTKPAAKSRKQEAAANRATPTKAQAQKATAPQAHIADLQSNGHGQGVALTVRIEINLPAAGDKETYDRIFQSIRENLLNAK